MKRLVKSMKHIGRSGCGELLTKLCNAPNVDWQKNLLLNILSNLRYRPGVRPLITRKLQFNVCALNDQLCLKQPSS